MKKLSFVKMHGLGNDFIMINSLDLEKNNLELTSEFAQTLCNRNFGIGADGVIVVTSKKRAPFQFMMYNSDGAQIYMSGNGIRCYMRYLYYKGLIKGNSAQIKTTIGVFNLFIEDNVITVDMKGPSKVKNFAYGVKKLGDRFPIRIDKKEFIFTPIEMGSSHAVVFLKNENLDKFDLKFYASNIEAATDIFLKRTNVEFAKIKSDTELDMRSWRRGGGETLACGTGAGAVIIAGILSGKIAKNKFIKANLKGGILEIKWSGVAKDGVIMRGKATEVYEGEYYIRA